MKLSDVPPGFRIDCPLHVGCGHVARVTESRHFRPSSEGGKELVVGIRCPDVNGIKYVSGSKRVRVP